ncbi:hypothetical protein [Terricaulis silvestris]|uniref:Uncharacterized protein n=1 Tax=Terricaulis silvestris TaxID=2686094 RepID=A0A6I6MN48_9CAUL|nr:hypothetical protein [Terricaulis silvestris]QGZ94726.1 hypothetical protein DSM104635_01556 [Terricaulis silvestris]
MSVIRSIAASLVVLLAACGQPAAPAAAPAQTATTTSDEAKPDTATPATGALTPAMLLGRWGDNGDCTKDVVFNADGTFASYTGGGGTWSLNGDVMSMTGAEGTFQVRVAIVDRNTLMIGNADGSYGMSQRC